MLFYYLNEKEFEFKKGVCGYYNDLLVFKKGEKKTVYEKIEIDSKEGKILYNLSLESFSIQGVSEVVYINRTIPNDFIIVTSYQLTDKAICKFNEILKIFSLCQF